MFLDKATLKLYAGKGGDGIIAWRREKYIPKGGPCGGNGGRGGAVYIQTEPGIYSLEHFRHLRFVRAENGKQGGTNLCQGKSGKDLIIKVPCGTLVKNASTGELLLDLTEKNEKHLLCQGGKGGKGNDFFKTPTNQAPHHCTQGKEGESLEIELELKLIADVGFIGLPNAGKSTLLSKVTTAKVKIGDYPFTTLVPNLSFIEFDDFSRIYIADIPGIIEKAHENKGLGLAFLRHIERCSMLIFLIDASAIDKENPLKDLFLLQNELKNYDPALLNKPFLIAVNKLDIPESQENFEIFKKIGSFSDKQLFAFSALSGEGLQKFVDAMRCVAQSDGKKYE